MFFRQLPLHHILLLLLDLMMYHKLHKLRLQDASLVVHRRCSTIMANANDKNKGLLLFWKPYDQYRCEQDLDQELRNTGHRKVAKLLKW